MNGEGIKICFALLGFAYEQMGGCIGGWVRWKIEWKSEGVWRDWHTLM